jgi:glycine C-acetyltransferase
MSSAPQPGSNYSDLTLLDVFLHGRRLGFRERTSLFSDWLTGLLRHDETGLQIFRHVLSPADREVLVRNHDGTTQQMLMFGSNSYLGLATHPYVKERVRAVIDEFGAGIGGPPMLNGYLGLHRALEERLAAFEGTEECVLFGSGYSANVGLMSSVPSKHDTVLYDELSHASFIDGLGLGGHTGITFPHNDLAALDRQLAAFHGRDGDRFVGVEGVYSMDGDLAPLDGLVATCKKHGAILVLDDAHGTGITGPGGTGTARRFGVHGEVDLVMGTFSKAFGVSGGFVCCSKPVADFLRLCSRAYVFSASIPPMTVAAVHAGLDLLEREPEIHARLMDNVRYLSDGLRRLGFPVHGDSAIAALPVPVGMDIRAMAFDFHQRGFFLNHIEFPAVKPSAQRFRVSVMTKHTHEDIDRLLAAIEEIWASHAATGDGEATGSPRIEVQDAE